MWALEILRFWFLCFIHIVGFDGSFVIVGLAVSFFKSFAELDYDHVVNFYGFLC